MFMIGAGGVVAQITEDEGGGGSGDNEAFLGGVNGLNIIIIPSANAARHKPSTQVDKSNCKNGGRRGFGVVHK